MISDAVVAVMRKTHVRVTGRTEAAPIYMYCVQVAIRGYCSMNGGGNGQAIGSIVSDAMVCS